MLASRCVCCHPISGDAPTYSGSMIQWDIWVNSGCGNPVLSSNQLHFGQPVIGASDLRRKKRIQSVSASVQVRTFVCHFCACISAGKRVAKPLNIIVRALLTCKGYWHETVKHETQFNFYSLQKIKWLPSCESWEKNWPSPFAFGILNTDILQRLERRAKQHFSKNEGQMVQR